ncbi:MAG: transposase [Pyrinomonadaceae bacterium]|nr:transposase [Pyrinomonadaceae bacterium]
MLSRAVFHYREHRRDDRAVRQRIREIAEMRVRYGFARIQILLRREGWRDNHKRPYRIYREEGLNLRSKRTRPSKAAAHRQERPVLTGPQQCWSMDLVSDQLFDSWRFRGLTLVDYYSRDCLEIEVGQSLKGFCNMTTASPARIPGCVRTRLLPRVSAHNLILGASPSNLWHKHRR